MQEALLEALLASQEVSFAMDHLSQLCLVINSRSLRTAASPAPNDVHTVAC